MTRVTLPAPVTLALDAVAARRGITRRDAVILAAGFLQAAEDARLAGLCVGAVRDREALERVIVVGASPK